MLAEQPFLIAYDVWTPVRKGNKTAIAIFDRHYSCERAEVRKVEQITGPGEYMMMLTADARALFVWRKFLDDSGQTGINCAVFRNEGVALSSELIRAADLLADARWPGERHYTYVNAKNIRSSNPGYCFLMAGWRRCGVTKKRKLIILEREAPDVVA